MDAQKVDMFLMTNSSKLPASHIPIIRDRLLDMDESKLIYLQTCDFKDPTIILIIGYRPFSDRRCSLGCRQAGHFRRLRDLDDYRLVSDHGCDEKEEPGTVAEYFNVLIPATCGKEK